MSLGTLFAVGFLDCAVSQAWPGPYSSTDSTHWCGGAPSSDWACARWGYALAGTSPLRANGARRIDSGTAVWAEQGSSARVSLRNQARCTIGGGATSSEVITRPRLGILLRQRQGDSACTTPRHPVSIELCAGDDCTALLEAEGTALASILPPEATVSATESFYRRTRIVSCSGYVRVSAGGKAAAGGAARHNRFVIEIIESSSKTEGSTTTVTTEDGVTIRAEGGTSSASSVSVVEIGELPGRGPCAASFVRQGERSVEG